MTYCESLANNVQAYARIDRSRWICRNWIFCALFQCIRNESGEARLGDRYLRFRLPFHFLLPFQLSVVQRRDMQADSSSLLSWSHCLFLISWSGWLIQLAFLISLSTELKNRKSKLDWKDFLTLFLKVLLRGPIMAKDYSKCIAYSILSTMLFISSSFYILSFFFVIEPKMFKGGSQNGTLRYSYLQDEIM